MKPRPVQTSDLDLTGVATLYAFSLLVGLNQPLVRLVNDGFHPVFQVGLRSAAASPGPKTNSKA